MVKPNATSDAIHPNTVPTIGPSTAGAGQTGNNAMVRANASRMRLRLEPAETPGIGTMTITPETRASTRRNPYNLEKFRARSTCIAAEITEHKNGERNQLGRHPGQQQQPEQECRQTGDRPKTGV